MKIYIGTDHAAFELKEKLKQYLFSKHYIIEDCGAYSFNPDDDYPDFIETVAKKVSIDKTGMGIVLGKSGAGECIVANKIRGIRAVLGFCEENVKLSREHNNANILSLGSQFVSEDTAEKLTDLFLETPFSGEERHQRRIDKITKIEEQDS